MFSYQSTIFKGIPTILLIIGLASCTRTSSEDEIDAISYFEQFGYLQRGSNSNGRMIMNEELVKATREFQRFFGLSQTGELDDKTKKLMSEPRCGIADKDPSDINNGIANYEKQYSRWYNKQLTYKIVNYPTNLLLTAPQVRSEIKRAFELWSQHTDLTFEHKETGPVHIEILFASGAHGCRDKFDGPSKVLAHAYFPNFGGNAHFDDAETWTMNTEYGINLFIVAAHEFGHSLGLDHSNVKLALMAPVYHGFKQSFQLHEDDIEGIQAIYGKKKETPSADITPTTSRPKTTVKPKRTAMPYALDICRNPKVDAMFSSLGGEMYAFKGAYFYRFTQTSVAEGYPKLISENWPRLPNDIDAAFTSKNNKTYFFKGSRCWQYNGLKLDRGFPKKISNQFPGIPNNLDAAMNWSAGTIFFKGDKFWYFDPSGTPHIHNMYPQPISHWRGVPNNLNAVGQYPGGEFTYFFKGFEFYRLHNGKIEVEGPYPKSTAKFWFNCNSSAQGQLTTDLVNDDPGKITTDTEDFYYQYTDTELSEQ